MSETTEEQRAAAMQTAIDKMNEGLADYLNAIADEGEPELAQSAVVLFEAGGMSQSGIFERISFVLLETTSRSAMLGMVDIAGEKLQHALRCGGHDE